MRCTLIINPLMKRKQQSPIYSYIHNISSITKDCTLLGRETISKLRNDKYNSVYSQWDEQFTFGSFRLLNWRKWTQFLSKIRNALWQVINMTIKISTLRKKQHKNWNWMGQNFYATSNPVSQGSELAVHRDLDGWQSSPVSNNEKSWGKEGLVSMRLISLTSIMFSITSVFMV